MSPLAPTPAERLVDAQGRPYFLWDMDVTLEAFLERLRGGPPEETAYLLGKLLRQAKPDDALAFVEPAEIARRWSEVERYLGRSRPFWRWLLGEWGHLPRV
jgi:hypothetical protein